MSRNWLIWMSILTFIISPTITWGDQQAEPQWLIVAQDSLVENMLDVTDWQPGEEFIFLYPYPESFNYPWQGEEIISYHYEDGLLWVNGELVGADLFEVGLTELMEPEKILTVISPREYLIELSRLPNLQVLEVVSGFHTDMEDEDLSDIRGLAQLRMLDISGCEDVTDSGLQSLKDLSELRILDLSGVGITGEGLQYLKGHKHLRKISFRERGSSSESFQGSNLVYLADFPDLEFLNLHGAEINDSDMIHIGEITSLQTLYLTSSKIGDKGMRYLESLDKLRVLDLSSTDIGDGGMQYLEGLTSLEKLNFSSTEVGDAGIRNLQGLSNLRRLDISQTNITDTALSYLKNLSNLEELDVSGLIFRDTPANITDAGLEHIARHRNLRILNLSNTQITDEGLKYLVELPNLEVLELTDTEISDAGLERLKYLRNLRKLDIQATNTSYEATLKLKEALPNCRIMPNQGPNVYTFSTGTTYIVNPDGTTTIQFQRQESEP